MYVAVQGLLVSRAYSLCQGNKIIAGTLVLFFLAGLIFNIYLALRNPGCASNSSNNAPETLAANICVCLTDLLAFCVCMWKVWGTWKLKRETGIQGYNDLVSILIRQTVSRFGFVITFTITTTIITESTPFLTSSPSYLLLNFQHGFSSMLLAGFALDLRQRNSAAIQAANITLPTIEVTSVMSYIHETILVEMGDHGDDQVRGGDGPDNDPPTLAQNAEMQLAD